MSHADPGGNFASDAHRRTLASLPVPDADPIDAESVEARVAADDYNETDEVAEILADLEADGHATQSEGGWQQTSAGLETLNAPIASEVDDGE